MRKFLAANFETAQRKSDFIEAHILEEYYEFLHDYIDIFTKNVFQMKDDRYQNLKNKLKTPFYRTTLGRLLLDFYLNCFQ